MLAIDTPENKAESVEYYHDLSVTVAQCDTHNSITRPNGIVDNPVGNSPTNPNGTELRYRS